MKKKYLNAVVVAYLAFISIFTIGITFQKIQAMKNDGTQEKMVIVYGDDISEGALYFICSSAVSSKKSSWFYTKLDHVFDYGRHSFFK